MSSISKLYEPRETPMQVAVFMSGSGTNAVKLLEVQKELEGGGRQAPYNISTIVTDNYEDKNNAWRIAERFGIPSLFYSDFKEFKSHLEDPGDLGARAPYFSEVLQCLKNVESGIDCIALAGYEIIVTEPLLSAYENMIINVHPADLSITDETLKRKYTGNHAVLDAILDGEPEIRASTHLVTCEVDGGPVLMISEPVTVELPEGITLEYLRREENVEEANGIAKAHQDKLKEVGDWRIFPKTLEHMANGEFVKYANGTVALMIRN